MASDFDSVSSSSLNDEPVSLRQRLLQERDHHIQERRASDESVDSDVVDAMVRDELQPQPSFRFRDLFSPTYIILFMWNTFHRASFVSIFVIVLLWASVFLYVSFYYLYIPALDVSHAIHFQFDTVCQEKCTVPFAEIQLNQYKAPNFFAKGQLYKIRVDLALPESDINWDQGMFMVKLSLYDTQQRLVQYSARPSILQYKSPLLRYLSIAVYWPLLVTGLKHETQHMVIDLMEDYIDGVRAQVGSATSAKIELEARLIQVYSSTLLIQAHLTGLRYFMVNWPLLTGLVGIATIFGFLSMITICGVYRTLPSEKDDQDEYSDLQGEIDDGTTVTSHDDDESQSADMLPDSSS